jgi:hypothetical protein
LQKLIKASEVDLIKKVELIEPGSLHILFVSRGMYNCNNSETKTALKDFKNLNDHILIEGKRTL